MPRTPKRTPTKAQQEQHQDAWQRFERAVDAAVKGGPKHRVSPRPLKPPAEMIGKSKKKPTAKRKPAK